MNEIEVFGSAVEVVTKVLKSKNKTLVESSSKMLAALLGTHHTLDIFITAMIELSKNASESFHWTLEELSTLPTFSVLLQNKSNSEKRKLEFGNISNDAEVFQLNIELVTNILKVHNKSLLESYEKVINNTVGADYTAQIFIAALFELSELDSDTLDWTMQNLYQLEFYEELLSIVTMSAVKKLTEKGFIMGQDFSASFQGQILIKEDVKNVFIESTKDPEDRLLFQQILQVA
jgi:hypothetical protein